MLSIRLNHPERDDCADASGQTFIREFRLGTHVYNLYKEAVEHPVSCARIFNRLIETVISVLFQAPLKNRDRKTVPLSSREIGYLSRVIAHLFVAENNGRKSLHIHGAVWTTLRPYMLESISEFDALVKLVAKAVDSMVQAEVHPITRLQVMRDNNKDVDDPAKVSLSRGRRGFREVDINNYVKEAEIGAMLLQNHKHGPSCCHGVVGTTRCRYAKPSGLTICGTCATQLESVDVTDSNDPNAKKRFKVQPIQDPLTHLDLPIQPKSTFTDYGHKETPLGQPDSRILVWEIERGQIVQNGENIESSAFPPSTKFYTFEDFEIYAEANGLIAEYNPPLTTILNCNTAIYFMGTTEQAKAITVYLVKYLTKEGNQIEGTLAAAYVAQDLCNKFPSKASNTGTVERNAIHWWQKFLLGFTGAIELSATQGASVVCGIPASYASHNTQYLFLNSAMEFLKTILPPQDDDDDSINELQGFSNGDDILDLCDNPDSLHHYRQVVDLMERNHGDDDEDEDEDEEDALVDMNFDNLDLEIPMHGTEAERRHGHKRGEDPTSYQEEEENDMHIDAEDFSDLLSSLQYIADDGQDVDSVDVQHIFSCLATNSTAISSNESFNKPMKEERFENIPFRPVHGDGGDTGGCADFVADADGNIHALEQHYHYMHRGKALSFLSLYEWLMLIAVETKDNPSQSKKAVDLENNKREENDQEDEAGDAFFDEEAGDKMEDNESEMDVEGKRTNT